MADEDISLTEDQLLDNLDETNNGDAEFLNEVSFSLILFPKLFSGIFEFGRIFRARATLVFASFFFLSSHFLSVR